MKGSSALLLCLPAVAAIVDATISTASSTANGRTQSILVTTTNHQDRDRALRKDQEEEQNNGKKDQKKQGGKKDAGGGKGRNSNDGFIDINSNPLTQFFFTGGGTEDENGQQKLPSNDFDIDWDVAAMARVATARTAAARTAAVARRRAASDPVPGAPAAAPPELGGGLPGEAACWGVALAATRHVWWHCFGPCTEGSQGSPHSPLAATRPARRCRAARPALRSTL